MKKYWAGIWTALALCVVSTAAAEDFSASAPEDAYFFISVGNVTEFLEENKKTPWAKLWSDPEMVKFTKPGRDKVAEAISKISEEWGSNPDELKSLFPGQIALWAESLDPYKPNEFGFVLVADRKAPPESYRKHIDKALESWIPEALKKSKLSAGGETIYAVHWDQAENMTAEEKAALGSVSTKRSLLYAFPEGKFVMAQDGDESIQRLLKRGAKSGPSLAQNPGFRSMAQSFSGTQIRLFINLSEIVGVIEENAVRFSHTDEAPNLEPWGVKDFLDLSFERTLGATASHTTVRLRTAEDPSGLAKVAMSFTGLDSTILRAAPAEPFSVSAIGFDLPGAITELIDTFMTTSPDFAASWSMVSAMIQMQTGLSLENEIIPALGKQICFYTSPMADSQTEALPTFILRLNQTDTFIKLAENIMASPGMGEFIAKTEFLGAPVYAFDSPMIAMMATPGSSTPQLTLALANGHLVFSLTSEEAKEAIRRLAGKNEDNFLDAGNFQAPADSEKGQLTSYSFQDLGLQSEAMLASLTQMQAMLQMMTMSGGPGGLDMNDWFDFYSTPQPETVRKHLGKVEGYSYRTPNSIVSEQISPYDVSTSK